MKIAVDAMGGDFAPAAIVEGAVQALKACEDIEKLFLVGDKDAVEKELARCKCTDERIEIRHASEVVGMGEHPAAAVRHKRDSSINRATDLVKNGEADAVFAAGSTGAAVTSSVLKMRTLPGIRRPGIAVVLPAPKKPFILIDGGATPDCSPEILVQFAVMGTTYARQVLGVEDPTVGLMSVGSEDTKGNGLGKETFSLLEAAPIRFYGNVEGTDLFESRVDVVVCDGFTGNVILKTSEGLAHAVGQWMKGEVTKNPWRMLGTLLLAGALKAIKRKTSNKTYGGAPLLGVNGICIIGHGSSDATAAKNVDINGAALDSAKSISAVAKTGDVAVKGAMNAAGSISLVAGSRISFDGDATAGADITAVAGKSIDFPDTVNAGRDASLKIQDGDMAAKTVIAGRDASLQTGGRTGLENWIEAFYPQEGSGDIYAESVTADRDAIITAANGNITLGTVEGKHSVSIFDYSTASFMRAGSVKTPGLFTLFAWQREIGSMEVGSYFDIVLMASGDNLRKAAGWDNALDAERWLAFEDYRFHHDLLNLSHIIDIYDYWSVMPRNAEEEDLLVEEN